jgi:signal transduction histidine kinase
MSTKKLKLGELKLSKGQLVDLFRISSSIYSLALHDLANHGATIRLSLETVSTIFASLIEGNKSKKRVIPDDKLSKIEERLESALSSSKTLSKSMYEFFSPYKPLNFEEQFISSPFGIVQTIKGMRSRPEITVGKKSLKSLEIVFPENILFGILSELVENAAKRGRASGKVMISWRMQGNKFQCEVHDDGPGLPVAGNEFLPLDVITVGDKNRLSEGSGLHIINRILRMSKGLLLFSNSKTLGGALVFFEVPVAGTHRR